MKKITILLFSVVILSIVLSGTVYAQTATPPPDTATPLPNPYPVIFTTPQAVVFPSPQPVVNIPVKTLAEEGEEVNSILGVFLATFMILAIFWIGEDNIFVKMVDLGVSGLFLFLDCTVLYNEYTLTKNSYGFSFAIWIIALFISHFLDFLSNYLAEEDD